MIHQAELEPVELTVDAAASAARKRVGLDDFGHEDWRERLELIFAEVDADPNYTELTRATFFVRAVTVLANRLQAQDLLARHPVAPFPLPGQPVPDDHSTDPRYLRAAAG